MCLVRIPSETKLSKNESLRRVIEMVSARTGIDNYKAAEAISWFLESVADEVSKGRVVQLPGFGAFFPVADAKPHPPALVRRCRVRFHPSEGFQQQVKFGAPPQDRVTRKYVTYRKNHTATDGEGNNARVFTAMRYFRESISAQLAHARD